MIHARQGTSLHDLLFAEGVEFPCGGRGRCKGCKVKRLAGSLTVTEEDKARLTAEELDQGWRLACRARAEGDLRLELAQWDAPILVDDSAFTFTPQEGWGIAIDLGTTTLAAQLCDLQTGQVLAVRTALNAQAKHGADIMSRVEFAVAGKGQRILETTIRQQIGELVQDVVADACARMKDGFASNAHDALVQAPTAAPLTIVLVGNTVMHQLFSGIDLEPLAHYPFEPCAPGLQSFEAAQLGWTLPGNPIVRFLPCLGGFVGSDILAGILATKLHDENSLTALIDLGTNGEIAVGNHARLLCAATAAGPAFEGARISMGMRAATGAISEVRIDDGNFSCSVLGQGQPRGICGSGLVDAVAAGLDLGRIKPTGRLAQGDSLQLASPVVLRQQDIRELQLAKGAIASGLRILLNQWGATIADVTRVFLAGAFGNYINQASARRIGLLNFPAEKIQAAGNTALLGAKLALYGLHEHDCTFPEILQKTRHVSLNEDPEFQQTYVEEMSFPTE